MALRSTFDKLNDGFAKILPGIGDKLGAASKAARSAIAAYNEQHDKLQKVLPQFTQSSFADEDALADFFETNIEPIFDTLEAMKKTAAESKASVNSPLQTLSKMKWELVQLNLVPETKSMAKQAYSVEELVKLTTIDAAKITEATIRQLYIYTKETVGVLNELGTSTQNGWDKILNVISADLQQISTALNQATLKLQAKQSSPPRSPHHAAPVVRVM